MFMWEALRKSLKQFKMVSAIRIYTFLHTSTNEYVLYIGEERLKFN